MPGSAANKPNTVNCPIRQIFDKYFGELCYFANTFLQDFTLSEDIAQETFINFWKICDKFPNEKAIKAWLYKTTRNRCLDHLKSKKNTSTTRISALELLTEEGPPELSELELEEIKQAVATTLNELPEQTAHIFRMSREKMMTYPEIAEALNLSVKSVEYHMSKALAKLRVRLKDYLFLLFLIM